MTITDTSPAPPPALHYSAENCSVGRALAVLGERSTFLVIREVFNGIRRFDDMRVRTAIPRQVLTDRLALLLHEGIVRKEPYRVPGSRMRSEYRLTQKGLELYPVLMALSAWGVRYHAGPEGSPIEFVHRDCGSLVDLTPTCTEGHVVDDPRDIRITPGPGALLR